MSSRPQASPFVQLKAGSENPPILIAHGLDGVASFSELAKHIRTGNPIYGIQAKGVDGMEEPFDRIEDMAKFYLDWLKQLQPHGPYILLGYSFGGLVALEMAQRLLENQEQIALLVLIDAFPHPRFMPAGQRLPLFIKRVRRHADQMRQMSLPKAFAYFAKGLARKLHIPGVWAEIERPPETLGLTPSETALRRVNQRAFWAYVNYRPRFYPGKIKLVTAETATFFPRNPAAVWGDLASELEVEVVPGDHLNIVTTEFHALAALLTAYVKQATCRQV